ncbi:unnamed protein product [Didymodactylos carnosus]|uniref:Uncharacterized protein n=1 Tax=Didymodactylos carnosus TaxID=1234261 RepID=A0A813XGF0_9BILA|nr:unnamed protein product [Didymodactylos carnosus]CAF0875724.1 unnamed protein product [Didymodactylos carnosus]CAF3524890.1 unnamed protein product [Didymodactylos carnosus]CAF3662621.1 unnamed protein product [Didymodactylos carnosus]
MHQEVRLKEDFAFNTAIITQTSATGATPSRKKLYVQRNTRILDLEKRYKEYKLTLNEFHDRRVTLTLLVQNAFFCIQLLKQEKILSDRFIRDACKTKMPKLWEILQDFKPCEAPYTGHGTTDSGNPVFCYQNKAVHPRRCTSEGIKNLSWLKSFFDWSSTVVWDGDFVSSDPAEPSEKELDDFANMTIELVNAFKQTPQDKYVKFIASIYS